MSIPQVVSIQTNGFAWKLCHMNAHIIHNCFHFIWSSTSNDWQVVELCSKYSKELFDITSTESTTITKKLNIDDCEFYWFVNSKSKSWKVFEDNNKDWITTTFDCCTSILVWVKDICFCNGNIDDANKHTSMMMTLPMLFFWKFKQT